MTIYAISSPKNWNTPFVDEYFVAPDGHDLDVSREELRRRAAEEHDVETYSELSKIDYGVSDDVIREAGLDPEGRWSVRRISPGHLKRKRDEFETQSATASKVLRVID